MQGRATRSALTTLFSLVWAMLLTMPSGSFGQPAPAGVAVSGVVMDQTGGALPGASVDLVDRAGVAVASTTTDANGEFHFSGISAAPYEVRAAFEGFKPGSLRIRVGTRPSGPLKIVLELSGLTQEITVSDRDGGIAVGAANNLDAVTMDRRELDALPVFDQDIVGTLSRFLDPGAVGSGGATLVVNGMEVSSLRVSASAIQAVKLNQDPYSAEYARPGRGRIEILTKPGGQAYESEANLLVRDARFDARNAFAVATPAEQKLIIEGVVSGPVGSGGHTSFVVSGNNNADDQQAEVFALALSGAIHDIVPQQNRDALLSLAINHQWSDRTTISIRPAYKYELSQNRGVGGTTLASAGTTFTHHEQQVTYTQQTTFRSTLLHQFQVLVGHEREPTVSASPARGIVVAGAFTSGGQGDLILREVHAQLTDSLVWIKGRHQVQAGFQLPDWSQRGFLDTTSFNGIYYFSGLDTYAAGRPYSFIQQQGNGDVSFLEKQVGAYLKDDWNVGPGLSASFGLRYDWQNYFHDTNNAAPRVSVSYAPGNRRTDVIRVGAGLFNDRSGAAAIADLLHFRPGGLVRYVVSNPPYPDPFPGGVGVEPPPSVVQLSPDVQIPQTLQYSVGLDHELRKGLTLSITYTGTRGSHLFRSRDVNAPLPPFYAERPNLAYGAIREIDSDGRQATSSLQLMLRGRLRRWFNGQTQYTWARADNDTNGINSYPANDYDLSGEWGRADLDRRHRLVLLGTVTATRLVDLGVSLTMTSAPPYSETLGADVYNNGRGRARPPGVPRNSLEGAGSAQLDLRVAKTLKRGSGRDQRALTFALDAFNILNRVNYSSFVGTVGSPLFGQPVAARPARQVQLSARMSF